VPSYYDSMLAKLIVSGRDRLSAIHRAEGALRELHIEGISTTAPFHRKVLAHPKFQEGDIDTGFIDHMNSGGAATHAQNDRKIPAKHP